MKRLWDWIAWHLWHRWRLRGQQTIDMHPGIRDLDPDVSPYMTLLQHPDFKRGEEVVHWLDDEHEPMT